MGFLLELGYGGLLTAAGMELDEEWTTNPQLDINWGAVSAAAAATVPERLRGIVEVDKTYLLENRKGQRVTDRRASLEMANFTRKSRIRAAHPMP